MSATPEYYAQVLGAFPDIEQLTVLVVAGSSRDQVAEILGADLAQTVDPWDVDVTEGQTAWALLDVPSGVLAVERTGYGDPGLGALQQLSARGSAAVVRGNILAHLRFGCARDGVVLFDDDEYLYVEDPEVVPAELRPLFDLVWDDLESDPEDRPDGPDPFAVGLAMGELITGVVVTPEHAAAVAGSTFHPAPAMTYGLDGDPS